MKRALVVLVPLAVGLGFVLWLASCYHGTPACNPGTIDWPQCDPTQPKAARDGGVH